MNDLVIADKTIRISGSLYCLNDLHRASGGLEKHKPVEWLRLKQTKELIEMLEYENAEVVIPTSAQNQQVIETVRGGSSRGGTFACRELVYSYAMWISPKVHLQVVRAFDALVNGRLIAAPARSALPAVLPCDLAVPRSAEEARALAGRLALERRSLDFKIGRARPWLQFWADLAAEEGYAPLPPL